MKILPVLGNQDGVQKFWEELLQCGVEENYDNPEFILVLGGDGTMLGAQRQYYKRGIPFIGIGFGYVNFLLNHTMVFPVELYMKLQKNEWKQFTAQGMRAYIDADVGRQNGIAFNDIYIKSMNPTGVVRLSLNASEYADLEVSGDGLIIASPQGSTAYNRNAGGTILPLGSRLWGVTGICTREKLNTTVTQQKIHIEILRGLAIAVTDNKVFQNVEKIKIIPSRYTTNILFDSKENFEQRRYAM